MEDANILSAILAIIGVALGILGGFLLWFTDWRIQRALKEHAEVIRDEVGQLRDRMHEEHERLRSQVVSRDVLTVHLRQIEEQLDRLWQRTEAGAP